METPEKKSTRKAPNVVVDWFNCCFVFGRFWVEVSARRSTILTERFFVVFLQDSALN
jgi:hypothetical protein